jgi:hypothetical protein
MHAYTIGQNGESEEVGKMYKYPVLQLPASVEL